MGRGTGRRRGPLTYRDSWGGEFAAHFGDCSCDTLQRGLVAGMRDRLVHEFCDLAHLRVAHSARGDRGGADPYAARTERAARVIRNRVEIANDPRCIERLGRLAPDHFLALQVD